MEDHKEDDENKESESEEKDDKKNTDEGMSEGENEEETNDDSTNNVDNKSAMPVSQNELQEKKELEPNNSIAEVAQNEESLNSGSFE